jgi:lipopolysaccharide export system protein LptC
MENKKAQTEWTIIIMALLVLILIGYFYIYSQNKQYNLNHPCVKEQIYCYHYQDSSGSGPIMSFDGRK